MKLNNFTQKDLFDLLIPFLSMMFINYPLETCIICVPLNIHSSHTQEDSSDTRPLGSHENVENMVIRKECDTRIT
jgi:hypothetical protein